MIVGREERENIKYRWWVGLDCEKKRNCQGASQFVYESAHTHTHTHRRENKVKTTDKWRTYQYWWSLQYRVRSSREEQRRWRCHIEPGLNERKIPTHDKRGRVSSLLFSFLLFYSSGARCCFWTPLDWLWWFIFFVFFFCDARVRKCCLVYFWQFETFSKNFWNWDWGNFELQSKKLLSLFSLFARGQIRLTTLNIK